MFDNKEKKEKKLSRKVSMKMSFTKFKKTSNLRVEKNPYIATKIQFVFS